MGNHRQTLHFYDSAKLKWNLGFCHLRTETYEIPSALKCWGGEGGGYLSSVRVDLESTLLL